MEPKVNYVLVGAFVVLLGSILAGSIIWLGKGDYRDVYDRYFAYMRESVTGLSVDGTVKYRGVEVGRVREIALNPQNSEEVRLTLDILRDTPVKEDTVAVLETQGLTGLAIVNLTGGSRESPPLSAQPGEPYPVIRTGPSLFFRVDEALSRLLAGRHVSNALTEATALAEDARAVLDADNRAALKQILADLARLTDALSARTESIDHTLAAAERAANGLAHLSTELDRRLPRLIERVDRSAAAIETMTRELARTGTSISGVVERTGPDVERLTHETLADLAALVAELRQLTGVAERLARELEREPEAVVFGRARAARGPGE
jgi:phospholipid/cholesterol/gamma-HCH transport system substrate-binding protein